MMVEWLLEDFSYILSRLPSLTQRSLCPFLLFFYVSIGADCTHNIGGIEAL
jgi:hypothetical protein